MSLRLQRVSRHPYLHVPYAGSALTEFHASCTSTFAILSSLCLLHCTLFALASSLHRSNSMFWVLRRPFFFLEDFVAFFSGICTHGPWITCFACAEEVSRICFIIWHPQRIAKPPHTYSLLQMVRSYDPGSCICYVLSLNLSLMGRPHDVHACRVRPSTASPHGVVR